MSERGESTLPINEDMSEAGSNIHLLEVSNRISIKQSHDRLAEAGVSMSYSHYAAFLAEGDISAQLGVGGPANRRDIPAAAVDLLIKFYPAFKAMGGKRPLAPNMLRRFIDGKSALPGNAKMDTSSSVNAISPLLRNEEMASAAKALTELAAVMRRTQEIAPDKLVTSEEAAEILACKPRAVGRYVRPVRRGVYRQSDLYQFISRLPRIE